MTIQEAQTLTAGRMKFGNLDQIRAVSFLSNLSEFSQIAKDQKWVLCPDCDGSGELFECSQSSEHECDDEDDCALMACSLCFEVGLVQSKPITETKSTIRSIRSIELQDLPPQDVLDEIKSRIKSGKPL